jgi:hypothetical protein
MRLLLLILMMNALNVSAQCKTYRIGVHRDTLNCTDVNNLKQGKWVSRYETLRGEPGFEEEGEYKNGKKEGTWRKYSLQGDILAIEKYSLGFKHGKQQYFTLAGIDREESWKVVDPKNPYDTIEVPDLNDPKKVEMKVIKLEGTTLKHGVWTYYNPETGAITKSETYLFDRLQKPGEKNADIAAVANTKTDSATVKKAPAKPKPAEVLEYEKKNSGKKKVRVRDGRTGG